ncbi:acyl-[acyl-carrier-protein] thioesterase [Clostridium sp. WILCCON 0269]|uniref:Acyl-[acyl-carrier-protein] thioesterase n=1 Tax=Candidatus Clostridium eludens TaxID=3381663 RepID=A0ABW8SH37_9CLOT
MERSTFKKEYEVQYYEIDFKGRLLITSLMNYFGDIATKHSEVIGGGLNYLKEKEIAWVLYKWNIHINKYPYYGEKIIIKTKACSFKKFYAYRTFEVFNKNGDIIAYADSVWILIDINKRKILRITEDMYKIYGVSEKNKKWLSVKKIRLPEKFSIQKSFQVRYSDIDTNKHANNVKYVDWIIETIPLDIVLHYSIKSLNITYEKEALYGESITIYTELKKQGEGYISVHKIVDKEGKKLSLIEAILENK